MKCDENTLKRKDTKLNKCESLTGAKISNPRTKLKIMSEPVFPIKDLFLHTRFWQKKMDLFLVMFSAV